MAGMGPKIKEHLKSINGIDVVVIDGLKAAINQMKMLIMIE